MNRILFTLSLLSFFVIASCSEEPVTEEPVKEEVKKPLIEREPEVREYMEVMNELVDEYLTLGEQFLESSEQFAAGEVDGMESVTMIYALSETGLKIKDLTDEISKMEEKKTEIEEKLTMDDVQEFALMYGDAMKRFMDLAKRIEESEYFEE